MARSQMTGALGRLRERLGGRAGDQRIRPGDVSEALRSLDDRLCAAAAERRAIGDAVAGLAARLDSLEVALQSAGPAAEGLARRIDALEAAAITVGPSVAGLSERVDAIEGAATYTMSLRSMAARLDQLEVAGAVEATTRWVAQAEVRDGPLISVVTPTRNRPAELRRAVASVRAQTYTNWEMLVVDDGGEVDSAGVVAEAADTRIRHRRIERGGVCAARNHALKLAAGSVITYLDDDNLLDPGWLKAVAWLFAGRPDVDVIYGGIVIDDIGAAAGAAPGALPQLYLRPYDRVALLTDNLTDMGAIAHRAGLPQAHFDDTIDNMADWDLLIRLTTRKAPTVVPVIACYYSTAAANRLSHDTAGGARSRARILAAHAVERRLAQDDA